MTENQYDPENTDAATLAAFVALGAQIVALRWELQQQRERADEYQRTAAQLAQPSAVDEIAATFKDVMAHILVNCLDINDIVTADFPPEKAKYYKSGFTAAIVAVAMCVGVTDIAKSGAPPPG